VKWLKAQLAHYELKPLSGTKADLEARLKKAVTDGKVRAQPKEMQEMEKRLRRTMVKQLGREFEARGEKKEKRVKVEKEKQVKVEKEKRAKVEKVKKEKTPAAAKRKDLPLKATAMTKYKISKPLSGKSPIGKPRPRQPVTKPTPKPRPTFAEKLLGCYTVSCPTFSGHTSDFQLHLYQQSERIIIGKLSLPGFIDVHGSLNWVPMAKQSRVPCTWRGTICGTAVEGNRGEMEFRSGKFGVKVKGKVEGVREYGEIGWTAVKAGEGDDGADRALRNWLVTDPFSIESSSEDSRAHKGLITGMGDEEMVDVWLTDEENGDRQSYDGLSGEENGDRQSYEGLADEENEDRQSCYELAGQENWDRQPYYELAGEGNVDRQSYDGLADEDPEGGWSEDDADGDADQGLFKRWDYDSSETIE